MNNNIGFELQKIINELGITPEEFSLKIGVGKSSIYKVLRGDTKKITKNLAIKISTVYPEYTVNELLSLNFKQKLENSENVNFEAINTEDIYSSEEIQLSKKNKDIIIEAFLLSKNQVMSLSIVKNIIENERLKAKNEVLMELRKQNKNI